MSQPISRRALMHGAILSAATLATTRATGASPTRTGAKTVILTQQWDKTFPKSEQVEHRKVTFKNRYGITLAGDLYQPKNRGRQKLPALVVSGPFGAVKEQSSGLYAQTLAERGFVTLAFDPSFTGESGGEVRNVGLAGDLHRGLQRRRRLSSACCPDVDRNRIGAIGICGLSGMALTAATGDSRIKAVATASMYDMSRSMSRSYKDSYTREQRHKVIDYLSQQRWADAEKGTLRAGLPRGPVRRERPASSRATRVLPEKLPAGCGPGADCVLQLLPDARAASTRGRSTPPRRGRPRRRCRSSSSRWQPTST